MWWEDPELQSRLKEQSKDDEKDADRARGPGEGGPKDGENPPGGPSGKKSMFSRLGFTLPGGSADAEGPPTASLEKVADLLPPAFWQLIEQAQDLPPFSRYQIARRCVETTLKMMRPQEIEKALSGNHDAAVKLQTKVSNTIMSKFLLYMQVETENVKPRVVDLTSEYIEEALEELQKPSDDVAAENRLRTIRTPVKAPIPSKWRAELEEDEKNSPEAARLTRSTIVALLKTAEAVDMSPDKVLHIASRGDSARNLDDESFPQNWWNEYSDDWGQPEEDTEASRKVARVRMIRGVLYAIDVMHQAIRGDEAEATIAEWLGIDILLSSARKELLEERNVLTSWLNRGRGELKAEPTK